MKGMVSLKELVRWYESWHRRILPERVSVLGGEPLMHPELETILHETKRCWLDSQIDLITNGLLIGKMPDSLFSTIRDVGARVKVSKHYDDPHFNRAYQDNLCILRREGIQYFEMQSASHWIKFYRFDQFGNAVPYASDSEKAWARCYVKGLCITLLDNMLYQCPQLACYAHAVRNGYVSDQWNVVLGYQPLSPNCTREELETFVKGNRCDQCSICPEEFELASAYEKLNPFGCQTLIKTISGGDNATSF
jgi:hypothetical protein